MHRALLLNYIVTCDNWKVVDMKKFERVLKGLANRRRLAILKFLNGVKEANVADVAKIINLSFKSTSKHLGILANLDILEKEQRSIEMYYRLSKEQIFVVKDVIGNLLTISNSRE